MRPKKFSYTPADDDTDGFANDVNTTSGLPFTLAATTPNDGMAHKVIITPSGSVTGSYVITGTDADGNTLTETLATSTTNPVTSVNFYKTLTSVTAPSGIGVVTVDIGWTDDVVSPTLPMNWRAFGEFNTTIGVDVSGTIDFTVQYTLDNLQSAAYKDRSWWGISALAAKTADTAAQLNNPVTAVRVLINSLTAGATLSWSVVHGG